jgi:hypothetical protein
LDVIDEIRQYDEENDPDQIDTQVDDCAPHEEGCQYLDVHGASSFCVVKFILSEGIDSAIAPDPVSRERPPDQQIQGALILWFRPIYVL